MEWKEVRLGDVVEIVNGFAFKSKAFTLEGIPVIKIKNIKAGKVILNDLDYISTSDINPKYTKIRSSDILITMTGNRMDGSPETWVGKVSLFRHQGDFYLNQRVSALRLIDDSVDNNFLSYYLSSWQSQLYFALNSNSSGGQANITPAVVQEYRLMVPELETQRSIASILSSLDQKIELNNKINADLEEMAQAIFKNWFVDFEPFKDGKFVDSELGMIPEGWKVGTLGELCNFKRGKNLLTKNAIDEGVPVVAGGLEPSCYHNIANTGAPVITVSGSGANAGFMRMYHVPVWASDCSFIDISCKNFYFVYCFLKVNSKLLKHAQTGAVQPHVKPSDIHDFELVIPDKESIYDFQDKVKPFFDKIAVIQKENSRLSLLRDTLLPRLMSGELEVPE